MRPAASSFEQQGVVPVFVGVARDKLVGFVAIEENVFVNSNALQNRGYAYIPVA